jgi:hypothetical protein
MAIVAGLARAVDGSAGIAGEVSGMSEVFGRCRMSVGWLGQARYGVVGVIGVG